MDTLFEEKKELQDLYIMKKQGTEDLPLLSTVVSLWSQPPKLKALQFLSHLASQALLLLHKLQVDSDRP